MTSNDDKKKKKAYPVFTQKHLDVLIQVFSEKFPVGGLRDAFISMNLDPTTTDIALNGPKKRTKENAMKIAEQIAQAIRDGNITGKPPTVPANPVLEECWERSPEPLQPTQKDMIIRNGDITISTTFKRQLTERVDNIIQEIIATYPEDTITAINPGKASSVAQHAEWTALRSRWNARYGKTPYLFTGLRRVYLDNTQQYSNDVPSPEVRETFALAVEKHLYDYMKRNYNAYSNMTSSDPGMTATKTRDSPAWVVAVYIAFRVTSQSER